MEIGIGFATLKTAMMVILVGHIFLSRLLLAKLFSLAVDIVCNSSLSHCKVPETHFKNLRVIQIPNLKIEHNTFLRKKIG